MAVPHAVCGWWRYTRLTRGQLYAALIHLIATAGWWTVWAVRPSGGTLAVATVWSLGVLAFVAPAAWRAERARRYGCW